MDAHILLNRHAHAVIDARSIGVKQKVLGVDRHDLYRNAVFLHHANRRLSCLPRNRLRCRYKHLFGLDNDLADARTIDFSHQFNLVDSFSYLVLLKVLHQLGFEQANINRVLVDILKVVLNVEKLTLPEDSLHHLGMSGLHRLLGGGGHDARTLRIAGFVLCCPLTTKNTLIFEVFL